jgi:dipeptidyl aminopeptidase/acylaminoacyl peptidase
VIQAYSPCPSFSNGDIVMPEVTQHFFPGADGTLIHAWYLPPVGVNESSAANAKSLPLVLLIHGGPQGAFLNSWSYRWNPAFYAAQVHTLH